MDELFPSKDMDITDFLEKLPIPETEKSSIKSLFKDINKLRKIEGLKNDILNFTSVSVGMVETKFDVFDITKLIYSGINIMHKVKDASPILAVLYVVVIAGMAICNKKIDEPTIHSIIKNLLDEHSDEELLKECEGLEFEFLHTAKYLCAIGVRKLAQHEVSSIAAEVPFSKGLHTMGKLAKRITSLQEQQIKNYYDNQAVEYERLMRFIKSYCTLATIKFGLLIHHYFLLEYSRNSPCLADGLKAAIETLIDSSKNLLKFLVQPTKETAILHHFGNILEEKIPLQFLEVFDLRPIDLNHLCDGVNVMSCVAYEESKIFIGERLKQSKWGKEDRGSQNHLTFKKLEDDNLFHIKSDFHKDHHLQGGLWVSFGKDNKKGEPSEKFGTWKLVPVYSVDESSNICYLIRPIGSKAGFMYAKANGNLSVKTITEQEYQGQQAFWTIKSVTTDGGSSCNWNSDTNVKFNTNPITDASESNDTNEDSDASESDDTNEDSDAAESSDTNSNYTSNTNTKTKQDTKYIHKSDIDHNLYNSPRTTSRAHSQMFKELKERFECLGNRENKS